MQFPYNSAQILTDEVFLIYGGQTGTSSAAQRQVAYLLAEEQLTEHLSSFLLPTVITGSARQERSKFYTLEFGHVQNVYLASLTTVINTNPYTTKVYTGTAVITDPQYGYINIYSPACYGVFQNATVVYESGLATGTYTNPAVLTALTIAAQINLNELDVSLSNESTSDIGVQQFSNQSYSEMRAKMGKNAFGNSAASQRAARLVNKYRSKPAIGFN